MYEPALYQLYARAIGETILDLLDPLDPKAFISMADSEALELIAEIRTTLNDASLDDPSCFSHIDAIVDAFYFAGLSTDRHSDSDCG